MWLWNRTQWEKLCTSAFVMCIWQYVEIITADRLSKVQWRSTCDQEHKRGSGNKMCWEQIESLVLLTTLTNCNLFTSTFFCRNISTYEQKLHYIVTALNCDHLNRTWKIMTMGRTEKSAYGIACCIDTNEKLLVKV